MTVFVTELSIKGLCCALFYAFTEKIFPDDIKGGYLHGETFVDTYVKISVDQTKYMRVKRALIKYGGGETFTDIEVCLRSCDEKAYKVAFDYCKLILEKRRAVFTDLNDKRVSDFTYVVNKVYYERHKFTGFIRFKETASGILYAAYSPDNDITELLCPHFVKRLSLIPFIIHDVKRGTVGVSDGKTFNIVHTKRTAELVLSEDEKSWEELWKRYYKSVNIKERKNKKQQDNYLPVRYRKFMSETQD